MSKSKAQLLRRWNAPGVEGFFNWIEDVKPRIKHRDNRYRPVCLEDFQRDILTDALAVDELNQFVHSLLLTCMPRRHSKTTMWLLVVLWLFTSRQNQTIQLLGNSERHSKDVQYTPLKKVIEHTPVLRRMIPKADIILEEIRNTELGSTIKRAAKNVAGAFGDQLSVLWVSDLHAASDLDAYDAYQSALLDTEGSLILIDANTDQEGGHIHALETEATDDPGIYCRRVEYENFEQYCEQAPSWIDRAKARRQSKTQLPAAFERDILGKRGSGQNALFPDEIIERCKDKFLYPVETLKTITQGREYVVTGGLDRSKKLFGGDNTIWTVAVKVANPTGEPDVFILNQEHIKPNASALIKKAVQRDHELYGLHNVVMEDYEVGDLEPWFAAQRIEVERISAHNKNQNASFTELHRAAKEGRLHIPGNAEKLLNELRNFRYTEISGGMYSFGSLNKKKFKDDRVYSLNWALFASRRASLTSYSLGSIHCFNRSERKHHCVLLGGRYRMSCSENCKAFNEVQDMYANYTGIVMDADISISDFFQHYVIVKGAIIYQAV